MSWSAANVDWIQGPESDPALEIHLPFPSSKKITARDLSISVADNEVVVVKARNTKIWQARLYTAVLPDVEWRVENGKKLILELQKKVADSWTALLTVPLSSKDPYFLTDDELGRHLRLEMQRLPPIDGKATSEQDGDSKEEGSLPPHEAPPPKPEVKIAAEDASDTEFVSAVHEWIDAIESFNEGAVPNVPQYTDLSQELAEFAKVEKSLMDRANAKYSASKKKEKEKDGEKKEEAKEEGEKKTEDDGDKNEEKDGEKKQEDGEKANGEKTEGDDKKEEDGEKEDEEKTEDSEKKEQNGEKDEEKREDEDKKEDGEKKEEPKNEEDYDALLEDAADELQKESKPGESKSPEGADDDKKVNVEVANSDDVRVLALASELEGIDMETASVQAKHDELVKELESKDGESSEAETLKKHLGITDLMLEISAKSRELRSEPMTVKRFLELQQLDIRKARTNIGSTGDNEEEEYKSEQERSLTGPQIFMLAAQMLDSDPATAVHLLRVAAINKEHSPSAAALFSIYSNIPSSFVRGAQILIKDALREKDPDVRTILKVGELFNAGIRHFAPLWSLAIWFFQRAAALGSPLALMHLGTLHKNGEVLGNPLRDDRAVAANKNVEASRYFFKAGVERGSIACNLIWAAQLATGEGGLPTDLEMSKKYLERALKAESGLRREPDRTIAGGITVGELIKKVLGDEKPSSPTKSSNDSPKIASPSSSNVAKAVANPLERLQQLRKEQAPAAKAPLAARLGGSDGPADGGAAEKRFWEKAARAAVLGYGVYCIAFPARVLLLPLYYSVAGALVEGIGLGGPPPSRNLF